MNPFFQKEFQVENWTPKGLVVDLTRTCNEACHHCIVAASPKHRNTISEVNLLRGIQDAHNNHMQSVAFYGGEPFTRKEILYLGVQETLKRGMVPQIMTNGFWGISLAKIDAILGELEQMSQENNGIPIHLNISTDEFHTKVPLKSLARIIHRWLSGDDIENVEINLSVGSGKVNQEDILEEIWDEVDTFGSYKSCGIIHPHKRLEMFEEMNIRFSDQELIFPDNIGVAELKTTLIENGVDVSLHQSERVIDLLKLISINRAARVIKSDEDKSKGQFRIAKFHKKTIGWSGGYDFKLLGAGEALLGDEILTSMISERRARSDATLRRHEKDEILILGLDNQFYLSPTQLHYQISPLGENTGDAIAQIKFRVRNRHPIARIILEGNYMYVRGAGLNCLGYESPLVTASSKLAERGLGYEALYLLLKDKTIQDRLMEGWEELFS